MNEDQAIRGMAGKREEGRERKRGRLFCGMALLLFCGNVRAQDAVKKPEQKSDQKPEAKSQTKPDAKSEKKPDGSKPDGSKPAGDGKAGAGKQAPAKSSDATADSGRPAVNPSIPTITDSAALTPPGWLEADFAPYKNLDRDRMFGTPLLLKLTSKNLRLQYRLATDGYLRFGDNSDGIGDTYLAAQYLFKTQGRAGFDVAGRFTLKVPTQPTALSGTGKFDFNALFLFSRDFTKWQFHGDFNIGLSSLSRQGAPGNDQQFFLSAATNTPIRGGRWIYQNEITYTSGVSGGKPRVTTMQAFSHAAHQYEVYSAGLQWQLQGDGATLQVIFGAAFLPGRIF